MNLVNFIILVVMFETYKQRGKKAMDSGSNSSFGKVVSLFIENRAKLIYTKEKCNNQKRDIYFYRYFG